MHPQQSRQASSTTTFPGCAITCPAWLRWCAGSCYGALGLRDEEVADLAEKMHGNFSEWEWIWVERDTGTSGSRISVSSLRAWLSAALPARRLVRVPLGSVRFSLGMMSRFEDAKAAVDFLAATFTDREDDSSGGQPPPPFYQPGLERC